MAQDLVKLKHVAQDGVKVRASAGTSSFRRRYRLEQYLVEVQAQVQRLAEEREHPDPAVTLREQAARERGVGEGAERVEQALSQLPTVQAAKERQQRTLTTAKRKKVGEVWVSTTDPVARVMNMADGS